MITLRRAAPSPSSWLTRRTRGFTNAGLSRTNWIIRVFVRKTFARINLGKTEATVEHRVHIGSEKLVLPEGDDMILTCDTSKPVPVVWKWEVFLSLLLL